MKFAPVLILVTTLAVRAAEPAVRAPLDPRGQNHIPIGIPNTLALLSLATAGAGAGVPDVATANTLGAFMLMPAQNTMLGAPFFAVGSMIFSYLLLRGRIVPVSLAWLGVLASALLVVGLPLQLAGFLKGAMTGYIWLPMLAFEVPLGLRLLIKGVATPATR